MTTHQGGILPFMASAHRAWYPPFMTSSHRGGIRFYDIGPQRGYPLVWQNPTERVSPYHNVSPQRGSLFNDSLLHPTLESNLSHFSVTPTFHNDPLLHPTSGSNFIELFLGAILNPFICCPLSPTYVTHPPVCRPDSPGDVTITSRFL